METKTNSCRTAQLHITKTNTDRLVPKGLSPLWQRFTSSTGAGITLNLFLYRLHRVELYIKFSHKLSLTVPSSLEKLTPVSEKIGDASWPVGVLRWWLDGQKNKSVLCWRGLEVISSAGFCVPVLRSSEKMVSYLDIVTHGAPPWTASSAASRWTTRPSTSGPTSYRHGGLHHCS